MQVSVEIDFDDTMGDGFVVFCLGTSAATVEDEETCIRHDLERGVQRLIFLAVELFFGVGLVFAEELGLEADVAWFVDTMDVSESSGDREVWSNGSESRIHIPDILWLSIQGSIIDASVVNTYAR